MTPRQAAAPAAGAGLRIERRKREATSRGPNFSEAMRAAREPLRKSDDKSESSGSLCLRKTVGIGSFWESIRRKISIGMVRDAARQDTVKREGNQYKSQQPLALTRYLRRVNTKGGIPLILLYSPKVDGSKGCRRFQMQIYRGTISYPQHIYGVIRN